MRKLRHFGIALALLSGAGIGARAYRANQAADEPAMRTVQLSRGDIVDAVVTTGTLQAVRTVQVGSQVSGSIAWLGADFNSIVRKGQIIAKLDPALLESQVEQARANLGQARANLAKAGSDLDRSRVELVDAQQKYARAKELTARSLLPQSDLDAATVAVDSAQASLASQEAAVAQAQAGVSQSQASVNQNEVNLEHTIITAPIDGIVIQRSVDVGQTVAASLQSPTVFAIAADLTQMQVSADVDEADIGRIRAGQAVTFKVDAFPSEIFAGIVSQVRLQPVVVQNVTTYTAMIDVPNPALRLKPGMTANVTVEVARRSGVVRVPNAALRFRPNIDTFAALNQEMPSDLQSGGSRVWRYTNNRIEPARVELGITDGVLTELVGSEMQPGTDVAIGLATAAANTPSKTTTTRNPVMGSGPSGPPPGR
jgi:HlyD family secretion protein